MRKKLFLDSIGDNIHLAEQALEIVPHFDGRLPGTEALQAIADEHGLNLATAVLYQSILQHQQHGPFYRQVENASATSCKLTSSPRLYIVPGLYYREYPEIGGHGDLLQQVAGRFGITVETVPTGSRGSIAENVDTLHKFLQAQPEQPFWLASVSRGSAEVKWLLQRHDDAGYLNRLRGWVSFNGVVRGSRLLDGARKGKFRRHFYRSLAIANGINPALVDEMDPARCEWQNTAIPGDCFYLNVMAMPLTWDVTQRVQMRYRSLSPHGPNDGVVLLGDYVQEPGRLYPVSGVDHLMRTDALSALMYRLVGLLIT